MRRSRSSSSAMQSRTAAPSYVFIGRWAPGFIGVQARQLVSFNVLRHDLDQVETRHHGCSGWRVLSWCRTIRASGRSPPHSIVNSLSAGVLPRRPRFSRLAVAKSSSSADEDGERHAAVLPTCNAPTPSQSGRCPPSSSGLAAAQHYIGSGPPRPGCDSDSAEGTVSECTIGLPCGGPHSS